MLRLVFKRRSPDVFADRWRSAARKYRIPVPDVVVPSAQRDVVRDPYLGEAARTLYQVRHDHTHAGVPSGQDTKADDATAHVRLKF